MGAAPNTGFERLLDSVVRIDVREANYGSGIRRLSRGVGSGVIIDAGGHILTNAHVVSPDAEEIMVTLPNLERVDAELIGWDHWTDLALIRLKMDTIEDRDLEFSMASFAGSGGLKSGQTVYAVGTPNGLTRTVTRGIISNPQRFFSATNQIRGYETGYFNNWLQTDAAINPGNSGGPLADETGRIVGINTRSYLGANNLSFAVPGTIAQEIVPQLMSQGSVTRSYLGIRPTPLQDLEGFFGLEANRGLLMGSIDPGSPADEGGLLAGDILLEMDGISLDGRFPEQIPPISHAIAQYPVGSAVQFLVKRGKEEFSLRLVTEKLESRMGERDAFEKWGLSVQEVSRTIARERQYPDEDGVLVIGVQNAFPGEVAGLRSGEVILSVNREPVKGLEEFEAAYAAYVEKPEKVLLEVRSGFTVRFVVLEPR